MHFYLGFIKVHKLTNYNLSLKLNSLSSFDCFNGDNRGDEIEIGERTICYHAH